MTFRKPLTKATQLVDPEVDPENQSVNISMELAPNTVCHMYDHM